MKRALSVFMFVLLLVSMLTMAFSIQPVKASGTIYIRTDGSIEPHTAPIGCDGYLYTLTGNISSDTDGIVIERDNIVLNGASFVVEGNGTGMGVFLSFRTNVTIANMEIRSFEYGIYLWNSSYSRVSENNITENGWGMMIYPHSCHSIVTRNNITHNDGDGIRYGEFSDETTISYNYIAENLNGVYVGGSSNDTITHNTITANSVYGIRMDWCSGSCVSHNIITENGFLPQSSGTGISIWNSTESSVHENTVRANGNGITIDDSSGTSIYRNDLMENSLGVHISESSNTSIYNNNLVNNTVQASTDSFSNSTWDQGYTLVGGNYWSSYNGVDACWGKYQNITGAKDTVGDTPYVVDANNQDNYPLMLPWISRETQYNCLFLVFGTSMSPTILPDDFIWVKNTTDASEIFAAPYPLGNLIVHRKPDNPNVYIVRRAVAKWYENDTWYFTVKSDGGSQEETNIAFSLLVGKVVSMQRPFDVTFKEQTFTVYVYANSTIDGFSFDASGKFVCFNVTGMLAQGQTSYCNIFVPNRLASQTDDVRIGNTSVPFAYEDYIRYSVVTFETNQTAYKATIHASRIGTAPDIAVMAVIAAKTVVGRGYCGNVSVEVENHGDFTENLNVTLYGNMVAIQALSLKLAYKSVSTLTLEWNTTGFTYGNYTISVELEPLDGEIDVADNTFTDGWVIVAMVGDLTGPGGYPDGKVDVRDLATVARLFGVSYPDPRFNPNCDINNDLKIDVLDVATVARHFGDHYP